MGGNRLDDINKHCLTEFRKHWECLDQNNQQLWQCRRREMKLNECVFEKLVSFQLFFFFFSPTFPSPQPRPRALILKEKKKEKSNFCGWWLVTGTETGENDPGHAGERDAGAFAETADLFAEWVVRRMRVGWIELK